MKNILARFIESADQRYDTCGDYWEDALNISVRITQYRNPAYSYLVLIHELVEILLVKLRNIPFKSIDDFDFGFVEEGEPGDDPKAPYHKEHMFATKIEKLVAEELGIDWDEYSRILDSKEQV